MIGAISGDIIGSRFEGMRRSPKSKNFTLFHKRCHVTDDSVLTIATAEAILYKIPYRDVYQKYFELFPHAGYGSSFKNWAITKSQESYDSWGNGSAMRVSPVAWAFNNEEDVLLEAENSSKVTHNHPEGIKGAQSVALAIFYARNGMKKQEIENKISNLFSYDLRPPINQSWDVSCQGCVPQAFSAFLESEDFEDCVRRAIFKGGDSDTIAAIAGSIGEAYYGVPRNIKKNSIKRIPAKIYPVVFKFSNKFLNYNLRKNNNSFLVNFEKLFSDLI